MKNTELRIGNIVGRKAYLFNKTTVHENIENCAIEETIEQCRITGIDENQVRCLIGGSNYIVEPEMLIGIPITPAWVTGFNFVVDEECWDFPKRGLPSYVFEGDSFVPYDTYYYGFMPRIKYVHELQNLYFALTGKEL